MKQLILKVDDFRLNDGLAKFERLVALCEHHDVPISMGVIGAGLKGGRFQSQQRLADRVMAGTLELWNHSFNHRDMTGLDDAAVAWELATTTTACEQVLGARPTGFGAPFNKCNERVARIAREQGMTFTYETALPSAPVVTPEYNVPFDGQPNLAEFRRRVERKGFPDILVVQIHPGRWVTRGFVEMELCLSWLKEQGYVATTMKALLASSEASPVATTTHELLVSRLTTHWRTTAEVLDARLSNFSSYFLARFRANSRGIHTLLRSLDADLGAKHVVDVGAGLAQWGIPFFDFNREATVWAFDTNAVLCSALSEARAARLIPHDLRVEHADFTTSTNLPARGIDTVVCANALNYIPVVSFAKQAKLVARDGARLIFVNQTSAFNHLGVLDAIRASNTKMAKERALAELRQCLVRLGFAGFMPNRTTLTNEELEAVFYAFGFQLTDDFTPSWERSIGGSPTFAGSVFTRRSWVDASSLPDAARPGYRRLLCQAGHSALDDDLFGGRDLDLQDSALARMKARAGSEEWSRRSGELEAEHELGRLILDGTLRDVARLVSTCGSQDGDWLFAGAVAALVEGDAATAHHLARGLTSSTLLPATQRLLEATCYLVDANPNAAGALLEA